MLPITILNPDQYTVNDSNILEMKDDTNESNAFAMMLEESLEPDTYDQSTYQRPVEKNERTKQPETMAKTQAEPKNKESENYQPIDNSEIKTTQTTEKNEQQVEPSIKKTEIAESKEIKKDKSTKALGPMEMLIQRIQNILKNLQKTLSSINGNSKHKITKLGEKLQNLLGLLQGQQNGEKGKIKIEGTSITKLEQFIDELQTLLAKIDQDPKFSDPILKKVQANAQSKDQASINLNLSGTKNQSKTSAEAKSDTAAEEKMMDMVKNLAIIEAKQVARGKAMPEVLTEQDLEQADGKLIQLLKAMNGKVDKKSTKAVAKNPATRIISNTAQVKTKINLENNQLDQNQLNMDKNSKYKRKIKLTNALKAEPTLSESNGKFLDKLSFLTAQSKNQLKTIDFKTQETQPTQQSSQIRSQIENIQRQSNIIKQFNNFLAVQKLKAQSSITLRLQPRSLGDVKIELIKQTQANSNSNESQNSSVIAKFHVASETVKQALEANFNQLKESLEENSQLTLSSFSVEVNDQGKDEAFSELFEQQDKNQSEFNLEDLTGTPLAEPQEEVHQGALNSVA